MSLVRRLARAYARIWRTYRAWAPSVLLLSAAVFLPLGLVDALSLRVDVDALNLTNGVKVTAFVLAVGAVAMTGLLGEIFFSGAIAISLTHPHGEQVPGIREIARRVRYGPLIVVDLAFVALVALASLPGFLPGLVVFVFLGLSGTVVEIEARGPASALARSFHLVRGSFWFAFWILVPIEIVGDAIGGGLAVLVHDLLGDTFLATWLAEAVSNAFLSPVFAIAAVLLSVDLIAARDGAGAAPPLRQHPVAA